VALPRAIDQDLAHDMCGDLKEMGAVAPGRGGLVYQPQVGFVDQVGSLEAAGRSLPAQMTRGDLPQLAIGQVHQARFCRWLAIPEGAEETGYLAITPGLHWFLGPESPTEVVKYEDLSFQVAPTPGCSLFAR
jgi:hypothetical protein